MGAVLFFQNPSEDEGQPQNSEVKKNRRFRFVLTSFETQRGNASRVEIAHQPPPGNPVAGFKLLQQPGQGNDSARLVTMDPGDHDQSGSVYLLAPGAHHLRICPGNFP